MMEQKQTVYTHGNVWIQAEAFIRLMKSYQIDCVVDCRPSNALSNGQNTSLEELSSLLTYNQMAYLPFFKHFGFFPSSVRNKRGGWVYKKVIATESFLQGVSRIKDVVAKGSRVCIIDNEYNTCKSNRFTLIGKFLKEDYHVVHISPHGQCLSQEQIEMKMAADDARRKQKVADAQELGKTGEELTALYLVRNGYQILDRNWNLHRGCELDIVALKDHRLHFIEVKTRTSDQYGDPQKAINGQKMHHIGKAIQFYRAYRSLSNTDYQIDSVAVFYRSDNDYDLKHFLNIRVDGGACDEVISFSTKA